MLGYWQGTGGSLLTARFMAIAELRHKVPKLSKSVFSVFLKNTPQKGNCGIGAIGEQSDGGQKQGGGLCDFRVIRVRKKRILQLTSLTLVTTQPNKQA